MPARRRVSAQRPASSQRDGSRRAESARGDDRALTAEDVEHERGGDRPDARAEQVRAVDPSGALARGAQHAADDRSGEDEGDRERQEVGDEEVRLAGVPRDAVRVEREEVDEQIAGQRAEPEADGQPWPQRRLGEPRPDREHRAAGTETQQREADDEEGEVVRLGDREDAGERHLQQQHRRRQEGHTGESREVRARRFARTLGRRHSARTVPRFASAAASRTARLPHFAGLRSGGRAGSSHRRERRCRRSVAVVHTRRPYARSVVSALMVCHARHSRPAAGVHTSQLIGHPPSGS